MAPWCHENVSDVIAPDVFNVCPVFFALSAFSVPHPPLFSLVEVSEAGGVSDTCRIWLYPVRNLRQRMPPAGAWRLHSSNYMHAYNQLPANETSCAQSTNTCCLLDHATSRRQKHNHRFTLTHSLTEQRITNHDLLCHTGMETEIIIIVVYRCLRWLLHVIRP